MEFLPEFFTVAIIHLLAVMTPGPDFVLVSRNSLLYSRQAGTYSAVGLALGVLVHITYSLIGIGLIISKSLLAFSILKYLGAAYLIYIGYKCLRAKKQTDLTADTTTPAHLPPLKALRMGFLTNILNPKVTLFFFALFTQVIHADTPKAIQVVYGLEMSFMTALWFSAVATILSHRQIKSRFLSVQHILERVFGTILIALGIKVALSTSK